MLTTVKGIYKDGKIHLSEDPQLAGEVEVLVTFLGVGSNSKAGQGPRMMTSGMFADPTRRMSTLEDFKIAEYDDSEWDRE